MWGCCRVSDRAVEMVHHRVRVKFCGITRPQDALAAAELGADAIGLVFFERSPRAVSIDQARKVVKALPPFVAKVGLFVNPERDRIEDVLRQVSVDLLQFHGDEDPAQCGAYGRPYVKAIRMCEGVDLVDVARRYRTASGLLLDSCVQGIRGGSGHVFDWSLAQTQVDLPVILAGGLSPANVAMAIKTVRPYAVDVSGGIEIHNGIKDIEKMRAFMRGVISASF